MIIEHPIEWDDVKVARLWDHYARSNVPYFSDLHGGDVLRMSGISLSRPLSVLDFGCGPGFIWDHLRRMGSAWLYTGVDFSEKSVEHVRRRAEGDPHFAGADKIDGLPTAHKRHSFDVLLLLEVVEHLNDEHLHATLTEAVRLLKPGGLLVISTPNDEDLSQATRFCPQCGVLFHEWQHVRSWSERSLVEHLQGYGFSARRVRALNLSMLGPLRGLADRLLGLIRRHRPKPHLVAVFEKA